MQRSKDFNQNFLTARINTKCTHIIVAGSFKCLTHILLHSKSSYFKRFPILWNLHQTDNFSTLTRIKALENYVGIFYGPISIYGFHKNPYIAPLAGKGKGRAIPVTRCEGPYGCKTSRLPHFL
jgi:hypothetical protein